MIKRHSKYLILSITLILMVLYLGTTGNNIVAQENIIVTVAIPNELVIGEAFQDFEQENPGIHVEFVDAGNAQDYPPNWFDIVDHLDSAQAYATRADVLLISSANFSLEATRAGIFLDIAPLLNSDDSIDFDEFYTNIWHSFQWDNGIWALPLGSSLTTLVYNPYTFSEANLNYPTASWTLDDLTNAARTLTRRNLDGSINTPGFTFYVRDIDLLFLSLSNEHLFDPDQFLSTPQLDTTSLQNFLSQMNALIAEGVVSISPSDFDLDMVPMRIDQTRFLHHDSFPDLSISVIPGGRTQLDTLGLAVSAGSQNPEAAYLVARFLMLNSSSAVGDFWETSVIQSPEMQNLTNTNFRSDLQALYFEALDAGVPFGELRFGDYLIDAFLNIVNQDVLVEVALQTAQQRALDSLEIAEERRANNLIMVELATPSPTLQPSEISLEFAMGMGQVLDSRQWQQFLDEFTLVDLQVGNIEFSTEIIPFEEYALQYDCFYLPINVLPYMRLDTLRSIEPLTEADPNFSNDNIIETVLSQLRIGDQLWGLPLTIQPAALFVDEDAFVQANIPLPDVTWSSADFESTLMRFGNDEPVFTPLHSIDPLLMLMASFGGLIYDYRTSPPTIDLSEQNINAVLEVLNLAKDGYIDYSDVDDLNINVPEPIYADFFGLNSQRSFDISSHRIMPYPQGENYTPVSYKVGAFFISANTPFPEACYRLGIALADKPQLFNAMSVLYSLLYDEEQSAIYPEEILAFYRQFASLLQAPNAVVFNATYVFGEGIEKIWLQRAFEHYLDNQQDVLVELTNVEVLVEQFRSCISQMPSFNPEFSSFSEYRQQIRECAIAIDPSLSSLLNG